MKKCKWEDCGAPVAFDDYIQDYVCTSPGCGEHQEVYADIAFDDCRKCGCQCSVSRNECETFDGPNHEGVPQYGKGEEVLLVCPRCSNERYADADDYEYLVAYYS